jgi:hypothetical protein
MTSQRFVAGAIPEKYVEVDAARLLLILSEFSLPNDENVEREKFFPSRPTVRHFTPEYYLQKLDFLVRYPGYLAYEIVELHRLGVPTAARREEVISEVGSILRNREPELRTKPFRRFWYGAHERLNDVESWWYSRGLVFSALERRRDGKPQKYYFLTPEAILVVERLIKEVDHARWYQDRIVLIKRFFGGLTPSSLKSLQYSHPQYREAQLTRSIPDLPLDDVIGHFQNVMGHTLQIPREQSHV